MLTLIQGQSLVEPQLKWVKQPTLYSFILCKAIEVVINMGFLVIDAKWYPKKNLRITDYMDSPTKK